MVALTAPQGRWHIGTWIAACAVAETIGMTASASAARLADALQDPLLGLLIVVAGGLVEGVALGVLQAYALVRWLPGLRRGRWIAVTVVMAGIGWAAASLPSQLPGSTGAEPPLWVVMAGALLLGAVMGAALGAGQAFVLARTVRHPARWVGISTLAWAPAMAVIFLGATAPDTTWPTPIVIVLGALTGAVAGAVLGLVSGVLSPWLMGRSAVGAALLGILHSRAHGILGGGLGGLRVVGRRSGRTIELPVQVAQGDGLLVVFPAGAERKTWWRNLLEPSPVEVLSDGEWRPGTGVVVTPPSAEWDAAASVYRTRWPRVTVPGDSPLVVVRVLQ
ncbi:hypothetical protein HDC94_000158 [Leifsonia sp. AK011]|uniref:hypothetical protein n=1 Tax=Leifsonia sp. AK011 TaxID=2723075 RepID=UPI0015C89260|nr:hypothetical protein [Leifsonia sp. AK011]NYF09002.1 hypothetical protein [Leifsonia sp. AK011]